MAMEVVIEGEDGSRLSLQCTEARNTVIGRGCGGGGFHTKDRTVSRRHVSFQLGSDSEEPRVSFEVIGRNPFWVQQGGVGLKVFRKFDKGQLELGDRFSLSAVAPCWFHFNFKDLTLNNQVSSSKAQLDFDIDQIDLSKFDPVKEFGFLVIGHEFDEYPKGKIRNAKDWEWFLEEGRKDIDEDEDEEGKHKRKRNMKRKQKKKGKEDEEWGGESDDDDEDMNLVSNISKGKRPCYSTRSKRRQGDNTTSSKPKTDTKINQTVEDDDDDDETLGGFIVNDEENDQLEELNDDDEEEEVFEEEEEEED